MSIETEIVAYVNENWKATGRATLLSHTGSHLRNRGLWPIPNSRKTLSAFIETTLSEQIRIEPRPDKPLHLGLFPRDAKLDADLSKYFAPEMNSTSGGKVPRFRPSIWAAFAKPLLPDHKRVILVHESTFSDVPNSSEPTAGGIEILEKDIPEEGIPERDTEIVKRITEWCAQNKIEIATLVSGTKVETKRPASVQKSLLDDFLDALNDKDLVRITIPLDIIAKMRRWHS